MKTELKQRAEQYSALSANRRNREDRNCLSWWFPRLQAAGVPVPKTVIVRTDCELVALCDGITPDGFVEFLAELRSAADSLGSYPVFLRTGQCSGKHNWKNTCFLADPDLIADHVYAIVEFSELCGMFGELPHHVWAVREMLPTKPAVSLPGYGEMPLTLEIRAFIRDGKIQCLHPYWPKDAVEQGFPQKPVGGFSGGILDDHEYERVLPPDFDAMYATSSAWSPGDELAVRGLLKEVAPLLPDYWSVDLLSTDRGWYVTDCALGGQSFHWPGCVAAAKR